MEFDVRNRCFSSKFGNQTPAKSVHSIRMEANQTTVPSIVVYVTVPNKEAGSSFQNLSVEFLSCDIVWINFDILACNGYMLLMVDKFYSN